MNKSASRFSLTALALLVLLAPSIGRAVEPRLANIALIAKVTASSSRPEYPLKYVNDGNFATQWSTAEGKTTGQWLQFDWDSPQLVCGVALYATGPWTESIDVQARVGGVWVSVRKAGSAQKKVAEHFLTSIKPVKTNSLRFVFVGGAAYNDVEIYDDPAVMARLLEEFSRVSIFAAGDLRGRLMGTASTEDGAEAVKNAAVTVTGATPNGPWKETARTSLNGDFEVPLAFGTTGPIKIAVAGSGEQRREQILDSRDISIQLTPGNSSLGKDNLALDGTWEFAADPPNGFPAGAAGMTWRPIAVPAHWEMEGFVAESGRGAYRRTFKAPAGWQGKRVKMHAGAIYSHAQVWVNGVRAGGHEGGFTPFERDITGMVRPGVENELLVLVDARTMSSEIDNASYFAYFELAGIWQPVEVFAVPRAYISHLAVTPDFDAATGTADARVEIDAVNEQAAASSVSLRLRLLDPDGREVSIPETTRPVSLGPWEKKELKFDIPVKQAQSWNAEQPRLYRLQAEVLGPKSETHSVEQRFGFRRIEVKGRTARLNGVPLKFRGISRLDAHPLLGRALTPEVDRRDVEMIKAANFNMVRATIAPPHPAFLDGADERGLYVENEGPTCWGNHADDLRYAAIYRGIMCEYLERDRNHPCVVDWSICNESDFRRMFVMAHEKMRALDPTRLYSATWGDKTLDTVTYHHPISLQRIKDSLADPKPAFFDEVLGVFHGWEDNAIFVDIDPGMRDYWITGLPAIERALNAGENELGAVQFSWVDDAFLVPGKGLTSTRRWEIPIRYVESVYKLPKRGIVGDTVWGIIDGWRRPRPEYWLSKKLYSPVQIAEQPLAVPEPGKPVVIPVENWNQFTDLDRYVCRWQLGGEKGESRAHAAPMKAGTLEIRVKTRPRLEDVLVLEFTDERGGLVDGYRLRFKAREIPRFPGSGRPARIVEQTGYLDLDGAVAVRLLGPKVELAYDRGSGDLYRAIANGEVVMTAGPKLHLLKSKAPALEYPVGSAKKIGMVFGPEDVPGDSVWRFADDRHRTEGGQAVLEWTGAYGKDFTGGFEIRMDDAGDVEFRYGFTYKGPDVWVREIGLDFELPLAFDRLIWDRAADYSYYPEDHIGRPVGEAVAHPAVAQTIPAGDRPYALDDHPLGSNDFRSAKRNIYLAALTNKDGQGVQVVSDGTQSVRATVGVHDIHLKVLDYYGGMSWTYHTGYHYGPGRLVKTGEVLKGTVRLRFLTGR